MVQRLRFAAGLAILASMVLFGVLLIPAYWHNYQFQRELQAIAARSHDSDAALRAAVLASAARHGLPVEPGRIAVERPAGHVRLDVPYA